MSEERDPLSPMIEQLFAKQDQPETVKWALASSIYITLLLLWLPLPDGRSNLMVPANRIVITDPEHAVLNVAQPREVVQVEINERRERRPIPAEYMTPDMQQPEVQTDSLAALEPTSSLTASDWDFASDTPPAPARDNSLNRPLASDFPGLIKPIFTKKVAPHYPALGTRYKLEGTVILRAILRADGSMDDIEVLRQLSGGKFGFEAEAIKAVKQWRFKPGSLNGKAVDIEVHLEINFKLN